MKSNKVFRLLQLFLAVGALIVSSIIFHSYAAAPTVINATKPCIALPGIESDCAAVQTSAYSTIFGIPVSLLGVIAFTVLTLLIIAALIWPYRWLSNLLSGIIFLGSLSALWFIYAQARILGVWCSLCLFVDVPMLLIGLIEVYIKV